MNSPVKRPRAQSDVNGVVSPASKKTAKKLPVLLLSGFLGAGKTTTLKNILTNAKNRRVAVLVNDMAELNIDANAVEGLVQREQELVQLENGCICCTLRMDLVEEVLKLAQSNKFDALVIESTGISEPMQVAETFAATLPEEVIKAQKNGEAAALALGRLCDVARLDSCTTVVDVASFFSYFETSKTVQDDAMGLDQEAISPEDERSLVGLLTEQVEFADMIVLNKTDLVNKTTLGRVRGAITRINPRAKIVESSFGKVPLEDLLGTGRFDIEDSAFWVANGTRWFAELPGSHKPETLEYGVGSFIYRREGRPFHPKRLYEWVTEFFLLSTTQSVITNVETYDEAKAEEEARRENEEKEMDGEEDDEEEEEGDENEEGEDDSDAEPEDEAVELRESWWEKMGDKSVLLRSKGCVWVASYPKFCNTWGQSGPYLHLNAEDPWETMKQTPRTELVLIGQDLDRKKLEAQLDSCLITDAELAQGEAAWKALEDPFALVVIRE